jgi:hypothetical protein
MFARIARILVIVLVWLIALSMVYLFILKLKILSLIFHS